MQAGRTAHYAWLYRGASQRSQARAPQSESQPRSSATSTSSSQDALLPLLTGPRLAPRPRGRQARAGDLAWEAELLAGGNAAAAVRTHFIDAEIRSAVSAGIRQVIWLGPRGGGVGVLAHNGRSASPGKKNESARARSKATAYGDIEVDVFPLEGETSQPLPGVRALLNRSLVQSARTLFVCDGLFDQAPIARIEAVLRTIGDSCFGSRLACVYMNGGMSGSHLLGVLGASQKSKQAVPRLGEPTSLGLDTRSLPARLASVGLVLDDDVGLAQYAKGLGDAASADLRGYNFCRLATAHVRAPSPSVSRPQPDRAEPGARQDGQAAPLN